jgi:hypothetical protein
MVWYGMVWYGMVWYGMVWYGMVWYGMVWYGMVWYGMVWYGTVHETEYVRQCVIQQAKRDTGKVCVHTPITCNIQELLRVMIIRSIRHYLIRQMIPFIVHVKKCSFIQHYYREFLKSTN